MARIRILMAVSGADFQWRPGQIVDVPGPIASAWADGVRAELVRDDLMSTPDVGGVERTTARGRPRARG